MKIKFQKRMCNISNNQNNILFNQRYIILFNVVYEINIYK